MANRRQFIAAAIGLPALPAAARVTAAAQPPPTIALQLPRLAETGNSVPIAVQVASPMTAADHVTRIDITAPRNPEPRVASFHFSPASGAAEVRSRIRLAGSQRVTASAEFSDGRRVEASASVVVTLGACVDEMFG